MNKDLILQIHSIFGALVFISGLLQIILKKGGQIHRVTGQVYLYGWLLLLLSGAYLGGAFIITVGVFGFYFTLTGSRIGRLKNKALTLFDKSIFIIGGLAALTMLYYAVMLYLKGDSSFAIIFAVFGGIFLMTTVEDIAKYILEKPIRKQIYGKSGWYFEHLIRMSISFIAAVTAYTSIQNVFGENTLNFLLPTGVGVVLIKFAVNSYKKKLLE